jgi:voltage-gated potassium channel
MKVSRLIGIIAFPVLFIVSCTIVYFTEAGAGNGITNYWDALWWGIVTLSTVGYGDAYPVSVIGRLAGIVLIVLTLIGLGFVFGQIQELIIDRQRKKLWGLYGCPFKKHIVIIGWNAITRVVLQELISTRQKVGIICENTKVIEDAHETIQMLQAQDTVYVTYGDYSDDAVMNRMNIKQCRTIIVCSGKDSYNLISIINLGTILREKIHAIRMISTVSLERLKSNIENREGVSYVASTNEITGRLVASAAFEPEVARFLDDVTSSIEDATDELNYDLIQCTLPTDSPLEGKTVEEGMSTLLDTNQGEGALLTGIAVPDDSSPSGYRVIANPSWETKLSVGTILILLGTTQQNRAVLTFLGVTQGR